MTAVTENPRLTRRQVLGAGLTGAVTLGLSSLRAAPAGAADATTQAAVPLITRPIPATGQRLPVIGIGTNAFGEDQLATLRSVLQRMVQLGGALIDTAASYGESEQVIGEIVAQLGIRSRVFLATKLTDASTFQRSLKRLRTDHLDLLQVHNLENIDALWPQLTRWKQAGRIRYIGMTTSNPAQHADMARLMRSYPVDFIEVDYSIADRDAARELLPLAQQRRVAVIADVPLGGRRASNLATVSGKPLPGFVAGLGVSDWAQLLLKYVISHPAITCTIPGSTRVDHLEDNQAAGRGAPMDAAMRMQLEQYWDRLA